MQQFSPFFVILFLMGFVTCYNNIFNGNMKNLDKVLIKTIHTYCCHNSGWVQVKKFIKI